MQPLQANAQSCLRHHYAVHIMEVLTILIQAVAVYQACLQAITEGLEYTLVLLFVVFQTATLEYTCSAHGQLQLDIHMLKRLFGQRLRALIKEGIEVIALYIVSPFIFYTLYMLDSQPEPTKMGPPLF